MNQFIWWKCLNYLYWNEFFPYSECGHNRWIKRENLGYFFFKEKGLVVAFWVLKLIVDGSWTLCLSINVQTSLVVIAKLKSPTPWTLQSFVLLHLHATIWGWWCALELFKRPKGGPKVKQPKNKRVGARSLTCNISGVGRHVGALGWD
jgi:hypothetical protein